MNKYNDHIKAIKNNYPTSGYSALCEALDCAVDLMSKEMESAEKCEWSRESDDVWRSDCGLLWEFDNEETPKANNMNYCPQCGKILEEAPECWEEAE